MSAAVGGSRNPDAFLISMRKLCYLFEHVQLCMRNMLTVFKGAGAGCGQGEEGGGRSQGWRGGRGVLRRRRGKRRNPIERVLRAPVSDVIEIIIKRERATMSSLLQLPFDSSFFLSFLNRARGIMGRRNEIMEN